MRAWRGEWDGWELAGLTALVVSPYLQQLVGEHVPFGLGALLLGFALLARRLRLEGAGQPAPQARADALLAPPQTA